MRKIIIILFSGTILASCGIRRFQPVSEGYTGEVRVDSVVVFDSVFVDRIRIVKEKADTVYVTDARTEYKYKYLDRVKVDTLIQVQREVVTEVQEIEKPLTWWQRFRLKAFWWLLAAVGLWIGWKSRKLWLKINPAGL